MLTSLVIHPHLRVGPVTLGASRCEVRQALAQLGINIESSRKSLDCFCEARIEVEYDDGTVSFIGVGADVRVACMYEGTNLFDTSAQRAFELIAGNESGAHYFTRAEYVFPDQIITLYDADEQYDYWGDGLRKVFGQVGIGDSRYLRAIGEL